MGDKLHSPREGDTARGRRPTTKHTAAQPPLRWPPQPPGPPAATGSSPAC